MNTLNVRAAPGLKMPKEGAPRTYITETETVQVPATHYYRKAIADGDLVEEQARQNVTMASTQDVAKSDDDALV